MSADGSCQNAVNEHTRIVLRCGVRGKILDIEYKNLLSARGFLVVNEVDLRRYAFFF